MTPKLINTKVRANVWQNTTAIKTIKALNKAFSGFSLLRQKYFCWLDVTRSNGWTFRFPEREASSENFVGAWRKNYFCQKSEKLENNILANEKCLKFSTLKSNSLLHLIYWFQKFNIDRNNLIGMGSSYSTFLIGFCPNQITSKNLK